MSLQQIQAESRQLLSTLGRAGLHSLYPNEFEYYLCSFELTDSKGNTEEFLVLPIMPDQISETNQSLVNVKKSSRGVVSLHNSSFVPFNINITGTFGRRLRVLLGNGEFNASSLSSKSFQSTVESVGSVFNSQIKTGYGVLKVLERIYKKSFDLDSYGSTHRLFFYNLSLNSNNLVEIISFNKNQNRGTNMMWNYSIEMRAIAPADLVHNSPKKSVIKSISFGVLNDNLDFLMNQFEETYRIRQTKKI